MANELQSYFESATSIDALDNILENAVATGVVGAANDPYPLLKIDQASGQLIFGAENVVLVNGSDWVVNPYSFEQGWVAWDDNRTKKGEIMVPLGEKVPEPTQTGIGWNWTQQIAFQLADVDDPSMVIKLCNSSKGAQKAFSSLLSAMRSRPDQAHAAPVVRPFTTSYELKKFGRTVWEPKFPISDWMNPETGARLSGGEADTDAGPEANAASPVMQRATRRTKVTVE
jgi:hypothetical protein